MRIYRISKSYRDMNTQEFHNQIGKDPLLNETYNLAQEAYRRNDLEAINAIIIYSSHVMDINIAKLIIKTIANNIYNCEYVLRNLIAYHRDFDIHFEPDLMPICIATPKTMAVSLLEYNTYNGIVNRIIDRLNLALPKLVQLANSPVLKEIINFLKDGWKWSNIISANMLCTRLTDNPTDSFIMEASKYHLSPDVYNIFRDYAIRISQLSKLKQNLEKNNFPGPILARRKDDIMNNSDPNETIKWFIDILEVPNNNDYTEMIWEMLITNINNDSTWVLPALVEKYDGRNIMEMFLNNELDVNHETVMVALINIIQEYYASYPQLKNTEIFEKIIQEGLNDAIYRPLLFELPEDFFRGIPLLPEQHRLIQEHYHPEKDQYKQPKTKRDKLLFSSNRFSENSY